MITQLKKFPCPWIVTLITLSFLGSPTTALAEGSVFSNFAIGGGATRFASGDILPTSVVLSNFGAPKRVDILIEYDITSPRNVVVSSISETVAVETTSSFIRPIQIPNGLGSGVYTLTSTVTYPGQIAPASSKFRFKIEPKIFGIFLSDFVLCLIGLILLAGMAAFIGNFYAGRRISRGSPLEYKKTPTRDRLFYEITSDIIAQIRNQIGNKALIMANQIDGLLVDNRTGRVIKMEKDPSEIIALLIYKYENALGRKITATPEPIGKDVSEVIRPVNKNLKILEKYFNHK